MKKCRPIMIQSTCSHAGKSVLTAALLRLLRDRGFRAAPFKAQNMALNSAVTRSGHEIGRAQAFQAEAAGIEATFDMNPILLKPTGDAVSQVIIHGKVFGSMSAREYHSFKKEAKRFVVESYERLSAEYEVIVIEGAGSPAEVNLRENDIANMGVAEMFDAPVILAGDIDRGGVFAHLVGTLELLSQAERERVKGFIINKFRGDIGLLKPGLEFLEARTKKSVLGVVPYFKEMLLPDEDGVALDSNEPAGVYAVTIAVIRLPRISNFTDFDPFRAEGVNLRYIESPAEIEGADAVIIPGTKNTISDLKWLKDRGFGEALRSFRERGCVIFGVCGGFQMLGREVNDPFHIESSKASEAGLAFLDCATTILEHKKTFNVRASLDFDGKRFDASGYEIHMGETKGRLKPFSRISERNGEGVEVLDGGVEGAVFGTYIHGIFDNDAFRLSFLDMLHGKKGLSARAETSFAAKREDALTKWGALVDASVDIDAIMKIMGLGLNA
ncbi:MAG: cobyric acid synthase CobQ [Deltaproteobacteria bacterium GWB2_55_19]|nr:MAG: cobyric acid synthase CobQ [Deltaproteobacteria bacterium GWB2_55_19]